MASCEMSEHRIDAVVISSKDVDECALAAWLDTRPECVRRMYREFPCGSEVTVDGVRHWIIGYTEDDSLIISKTNPSVDYEKSTSHREYICAKHVRKFLEGSRL
jgi:hypothetical protein